MSSAWAPGLLGLLDGRDLDDKVGVIAQLVTVDEDGWPHIALLSAGEIVLQQPDVALLALWPRSGTSANLVARGVGLLALAFEETWWLARLEVRATVVLDDLESPRLGVRAELADLRADSVPYARLTGGLHFELADPAGTVRRWRGTIAVLKTAFERF